ncbi:MAG: ribosomal L7Ae/L30e/S12e/Gadd45 family protein [Syntrophomonadaceae bacterium]|jgi:large subunit ribosomal protein L7A|nr:ribosomal L7Ae/L30e/S12e/Gadd45 family protein [Syntrophomonadaceae bacterium]
MLSSEIKNEAKVIGIKQVKKAINKGLAKKVIIANDIEPHIGEPLKRMCEQKSIEFVIADDMKILGQICGIEVGAATIALIKSDCI